MLILTKNFLKLSTGTGLLIGIISVFFGMWLEAEWWIRNWQLIRETIAFFLGIIYTFNYSSEIISAKYIQTLIAKYSIFVYIVILTWLIWTILIWSITQNGRVEHSLFLSSILNSQLSTLDSRLSTLNFYFHSLYCLEIS